MSARGLANPWLLLTALLTGAGVVTILAHPYPPMNDASSHVATAYILGEVLRGDPFFAQHYDFSWMPVPYWSVTWALLALEQVVSPVLAWRLLFATYAAAMPLCYFLLLRRTAPGSGPIAGVAALAVFNLAYWYGELNYLAGQPLLLLGYALFLGTERIRSWRFAGFLLCAVAIYFSHVFALTGLVAVLWTYCGASLLGRRWRPLESLRANRAQWTAALAALGLFFAAAWFIFFHHGTEANAGELVFDLARHRLFAVAGYAFNEPGGRIYYAGLFFVAVLFAILLAPHVMAALGRGAPRSACRSAAQGAALHLPMLLPAIALFALAYLGPAGVREGLGFEDVGERFSLCAMLLGLGSVRFPRGRAWQAALFSAILGFGVLRLGSAWSLHAEHEGVAARLSGELLARIPPHSRVLPLADEEPDAFRTLRHRYANWAVVERRAYSPLVFARSGQQPLRHRFREEYRNVTDLDVTPEEWSFYDWVLVQSQRERPPIRGLVEHAVFVARVADFHLYRVEHGDP